MSEESFTSNTSTTVSKGKIKPFNACTTRITGMGLMPLTPKKNPVSKTTIQTQRTRTLSSTPNTVRVIIDAAKGDVIADEKPAANKPSANANDPVKPILV